MELTDPAYFFVEIMVPPISRKVSCGQLRWLG
jgi:hypothetical protein